MSFLRLVLRDLVERALTSKNHHVQKRAVVELNRSVIIYPTIALTLLRHASHDRGEAHLTPLIEEPMPPLLRNRCEERTKVDAPLMKLAVFPTRTRMTGSRVGLRWPWPVACPSFVCNGLLTRAGRPSSGKWPWSMRPPSSPVWPLGRLTVLISSVLPNGF